MAYTQENPQAAPAVPSAAGDPRTTNGPVGDDSAESSAADLPWIVDEHHIVGPHGEDEIEATDDRGRSWYHPRPEPRGRADLMGFNYTWWLILLFVVLVFLPW